MRVSLRRLALLALLGTLLVFVFAASASAETVDSGSCGETASWTLDGSGLLRISGTGGIQDYGIVLQQDPDDPHHVESSYYGEPPWLAYKNQVTALEIGSGITGIGRTAFQGMEKIETVSFPDSLLSIGYRAFYGCSGLRSVSLPSGMKSLGEESFSSCHGMKELRLPSGLTTVGAGAFAYCSALEAVTMPACPTELPPRMFEASFALKHIDIPAGVTSIQYKAFYGSGLESIGLPEGLLFLGESAFQNTKLSGIELPDSLNWIGDYCFSGCMELQSIELPDQVTKLVWTFNGCTSLRQVKLPAGIKTMIAAFNGCSLESVELPEGLESIQGQCFQSSALTEITFPSTLREIGIGCFPVSLKKITFLGSAPTLIAENAFEGITADAYYPARNASWTEAVRQDYGGTLTWAAFDGGVQQEGYRVFSGISGNIVIEIGGVRYFPDANGEIYVPTTDEKLAFLYEYNKLDGDVHEQYPVRMQTYMLTYTDQGYQTTLTDPLQGVLRYAGSSIRITGKKGIRMITGVVTRDRDILIAGSAGYTLLEYGTVVAWDSELGGAVLTLSHPAAKTAYAYKRGVADPIFSRENRYVYYTNVLVGFTNDQCIPDLSMRPYMKIQDKDGNVLIIYGGTVHRSIGYIAWQNRNAFQPGSASYEYIWGIIHHVYGTAYDAEYKG